MTLEQLQKDMIQAMKEKDIVARDTIRTIIANVKKTVIDERCDTTEELVDRVLLKELKTINEMIDTCPSERTHLLEEYKQKKTVIDKYTPKLMTDPEEIKNEIFLILAQNGLRPISNERGAVMKAVMPRFKGRADMKVVNEVLKEMIQ